ncbi:MAG: rRNA maturation RNase YbeY [Phycisphaerales bacterium]|nr:MAG: rRNA maturation RNase YbeY [Phycisphaerales bacterium]
MGSAGQDIDVQIAMNFRGIDVSVPGLRKLVRTVCSSHGGYGKAGTTYEISIAIVDDAEIRELNARFLDRRTTTDCLSFDLSDAEDESRIFDLIVNGEMAIRQAQTRGHPSEAELALYVTHGLLHNLGFDDSTRGSARKMHQAEDQILQQLGYGFVYNQNAKTPKQ